MSFKYLRQSLFAALGIAGVAIAAGGAVPTAAQAESYPWCTQGSSLHCYYMNREQCEETVDYHGFCEPNPDYRTPGTDRRRLEQ
jgi:hypothetical protein